MAQATLSALQPPLKKKPSPLKQRRTLRVIPGIRAPKAMPVFAVAVVLLILSVAGILAINISVSRQQYSLVSLRAEQSQLASENRSLNEKVEDGQAPQVLAQKAKALGLVYSSSFSTLNVERSAITGDSTPATGTEGFSQSIPQPLSPKTRAAVDPTVAVIKVKESTKKIDPSQLNGGSIPAPEQRAPTPEKKQVQKKPRP